MLTPSRADAMLMQPLEEATGLALPYEEVVAATTGVTPVGSTPSLASAVIDMGHESTPNSWDWLIGRILYNAVLRA